MEVFETFNARYLNFEEVAESFIINSQFQNLIHPSHSILMGPRGCGKTTLLKMLSPLSIKTWNKNNVNNKIRPKFISVYIPSDKQWEKQFNILNLSISSEREIGKIVSQGLFILNVQIALLNTFSDLKIINSLSNNFEYKLSKDLISNWSLEISTLATFYSIKMAVRKNIKDLNLKINKLGYKIDQLYSNIDFPDFCFLDLMDVVEPACEAYEQQFLDDQHVNISNTKWALSFDELEIAPKWLQEDLIRNRLRSSTQKYIFKLTTSPIIDVILDKESLPSPSSDFKIIPNWIYNQQKEKEWEKFSFSLITSVIKRNLGFDVDISKVLGKWDYERSLKSDIYKKYKAIKTDYKNEFEKNTFYWHVITNLASVDESFSQFLKDKNIDPGDPSPTSPKMLDSVHRKIKPIVIFRQYFRGTGITRSRKKNTLYHGVEFIYKFSDGNPRTLINLINEYLPAFVFDENRKTLKSISIGFQASIFEKHSTRKLNDIKHYPNANLKLKSGLLNLGELLEKIGEYFYEKQIKDDFSMDSVGTFKVDNKVSKELSNLLKLAVELGAIQDVNSDDQSFKTDLFNNQYRFSYSIYPVIGIPPREDSGISLSKILNDIYKNDNQLTLWN